MNLSIIIILCLHNKHLFIYFYVYILKINKIKKIKNKILNDILNIKSQSNNLNDKNII